MSLFDSSNKGVKFDAVGATITGVVASAPRERQQTKYGTQEPDFYPNGDPKMQILVDMKTELRDPADPSDDGQRTLYVASKYMRRAISEAIRQAGASDLVAGGTLSVRYVGNDPASKNPANPAKLYEARYTPGQSASAGTPAAAAPPAPAPVPSTPAPVAQPTAAAADPWAGQATAAPAPVAPGALTSQQAAQLVQLRSAGIPEDTIATAIGATAAAIAAHDSTPF